MDTTGESLYFADCSWTESSHGNLRRLEEAHNTKTINNLGTARHISKNVDGVVRFALRNLGDGGDLVMPNTDTALSQDQPQLGLDPGVDVPGGAAVPPPCVQEAAHQPREAEPVPERRHPRGGGRGEDAAAADQHEEVPGGVQDRGGGAAAHPAAGQAALRGLRGDVQLSGPADLPPGQDCSAQVPQREEGVAGKRKRAEVLFLPSKKMNVTNNNLTGVEFIGKDQEVETDNVAGKIALKYMYI